MTDRELLEAAAKGAGYKIAEHGRKDGNFIVLSNADGNWIWSPLTDDGDALRLMVQIDLHLSGIGALCLESGEDEYEATRRAIVRAAAAMADPASPSAIAVAETLAAKDAVLGQEGSAP
jgi:hypothetical protein